MNKVLLGRRLRELRKRTGINQEKLAELISVEPATISNIENGKNYPSMSNLDLILKHLGVSFVEAFDFEHKESADNLTARIHELVDAHPERVEDFYKIITALVK
ncbi:MAG: helix-turn-helix domain-containing protein [Candidatus Gastranaerophilales bacterium]|nr:helix-turn-helix domain-containing protein [Candidatus Gastranaerophilales bacterium]